MSYICLPQTRFIFQAYQLVPIRKEDIYKIKEWRNAQMDILRQKSPLRDEDQARYYRGVIEPGFREANPRQILFSFLKGESCIGYGGLTNIDWETRRGEMSFLLDTDRITGESLYQYDFTAYLTLLKQVTFKTLEFHRLFTETYDIRPLHIGVLEKNGFRYEGRMKHHVFIDGRYVDSLLHGCLKGYENV